MKKSLFVRIITVDCGGCKWYGWWMNREGNVMKVFGYRNRTENGTERPTATREAAEEKIKSLKVTSPHIEWELICMEIKSTPVTVWKSGQGRAGNSYRASRMSNSVGKVTVLEVY